MLCQCQLSTVDEMSIVTLVAEDAISQWYRATIVLGSFAIGFLFSLYIR